MTNFCQMLVLYYEDMCFYADHVRRRLDWPLALQQGQIQFLGANS